MTAAQNRLGEPGSGSASTTKAFDGLSKGSNSTVASREWERHSQRKRSLNTSTDPYMVCKIDELKGQLMLTSQISASEVSLDAAELERQLGRIFQTAKAWKTLLLLDEADVFLQARSQLTLERNRLVAIFLRKMEFFDGVFFLITNLINDFDGAILNRIHLRMKYEDLDKKARQIVIAQSLEKGYTQTMAQGDSKNHDGAESHICIDLLIPRPSVEYFIDLVHQDRASFLLGHNLISFHGGW
ncbi:hypothetical protein AYO21_09584 [Fonsecaea monophora]|uniref:ATPase AAA-type core domain-containing protein n=1 Tax=Fonsecaea monophora TaxID=254056 RepID=A0A177EY42_9EURO|nr:hypothetical protein AYO21_09584 [Fonsecaea monophora]OAG36190.1 hypothetical protein AYO21_09584 [Fonsecaea monophora]